MSKFRSNFEKIVATKLLVPGNGIEYEAHKFPYVLRKNYIPDLVHVPSQTLIEIKGFLRNSAEREKLIAVRRQYPGWTCYIIFMYPDRRIPGMHMTHREWAAKNGWQVVDM